MEIPSTNNSTLQSTEQKLTEQKTGEIATPEHGGGVYIPKKVEADSVSISSEATEKLETEQVQAYHGGGVYVPPKEN